METLLRDLRYGFKQLIKRPGFAVVAILTLTLGIGANTAIFTLINAVLLKSLPVKQPDELVLFSDSTGEGTSISDTPSNAQWNRFSYPSYEYIRAHAQSFQDITAFRSGESRLSVRLTASQTGAPAQRASGHLVAGNFFSVLGVTAKLGRVLTPADDSATATPAAVVSHRYWEDQLNSDPAIVGKSMSINGTEFTIVGVTPQEFFGERVRRSADFWLPLAYQPQIELHKSYLDDKEAYWLMLMGRLKPGVSLEEAQAATNLSLHQFLTEQAGSDLKPDQIQQIQKNYVHLVSGAGGISGLRRLYSKPLQTLMAIVVMVLLIACANVGGLLLSRSAARRAEISLRMALGATRARVVRQLFTESLLLAVIGGVCGILISHWAVLLLVKLVARDAPIDTRPNPTILVFTAGVSIVAGILFGMLPAIRATRTDLASAMKEKNRTGVGRLRLNLASGLVVIQVALSMVLLTGAGLFARSLLNLQQEEVGFDRTNVLLMGIDPRLAGYKPSELPSLYQQLLDRLIALPNVQTATLATYSPMSGSNRSSSLTVRGYTPSKGEDMDVQDILIGPNFGTTLGVPLLRGREFGPRDNAASEKVAVVNQAFVDRFYKDQNPIGRIINFDDDAKDPGIQIVGVMGNIKSADARKPAEPAVYRPILQMHDESAYTATIQVRTLGDPSAMANTVRQTINQTDDKLPIFGVTTLIEQLNDTIKEDRLITQLISFFGAVALLLACIGLYGVMAHSVVRRTNEIGIRVALGAQRTNILWLVLRDTLLLAVLGLVIGIPLALAAAKFISSQLFGLNHKDPLTLTISAVVLVLVSLLAGYFPARRAAKVDPLIALRYE